MSRDPGPQLHTSEGGKQVDTEDESLFDWVAELLIGTLFFFGLLAAVGAVMAAFYIFWG